MTSSGYSLQLQFLLKPVQIILFTSHNLILIEEIFLVKLKSFFSGERDTRPICRISFRLTVDAFKYLSCGSAELAGASPVFRCVKISLEVSHVTSHHHTLMV